eukprot:11994040-Prorocentrum_lima.AAC.1
MAQPRSLSTTSKNCTARYCEAYKTMRIRMGRCPAPCGDPSSGQTPSDAIRTDCGVQPKCWRTPLPYNNSRWPFLRPA